jgi:hypothetical protein
MNVHKLQLKIFVDPDAARGIDPELFVGVFHRWIKQKLLPELVIDVANYVHVPKGPGVVLIGHGSDYFMDEGEGRLGLLHNRKRAGLAPADRLADLGRRAVNAAALLEADPAFGGKLRFSTRELLFRVNDRLAAPNTDGTFAELRPELTVWANQLFAGKATLQRTGGPKDLFAVRVTSPAETPLATLLERAGGPPAADASLVA